MPADLQTLIAAIPTAYTGQEITPNFHNTTRDALVGIATRVEGGVGGGDVTFTHTPILFASGDEDANRWINGPGMTTRPVGPEADGWFPVVLPDKSRLLNMTVVGSKPEDDAGNLRLRVILWRRSLANLAETMLVNMNLKDKTGEPFRESVAPTDVAIDNTQYQYYVRVTMRSAPDDLQITFYSFQFTCSLS
jgi:hypothetical protein